MTEFADRGLFDAETESARKGLPERAVSVVECDCLEADATPSPSRRGLKLAFAGGHYDRVSTMQHRPHREGD